MRLTWYFDLSSIFLIVKSKKLCLLRNEDHIIFLAVRFGQIKEIVEINDAIGEENSIVRQRYTRDVARFDRNSKVRMLRN